MLNILVIDGIYDCPECIELLVVEYRHAQWHSFQIFPTSKSNVTTSLLFSRFVLRGGRKIQIHWCFLN